jgi:hypothetical protein
MASTVDIFLYWYRQSASAAISLWCKYAGRDLERVEIDLYLKVLQTSHWSVLVGGLTRRAHCPWAAQD